MRIHAERNVFNGFRTIWTHDLHVFWWLKLMIYIKYDGLIDLWSASIIGSCLVVSFFFYLFSFFFFSYCFSLLLLIALSCFLCFFILLPSASSTLKQKRRTSKKERNKEETENKEGKERREAAERQRKRNKEQLRRIWGFLFVLRLFALGITLAKPLSSNQDKSTL